MNQPPVKVSLRQCPTYDRSSLRSVLEKSFDFLGGIQQFIRPQQRVFVKVNHLSPPSPPESAIVTHPLFVEQVLTLLLDCGAKVSVGDDLTDTQGDGFALSGLRMVCRRLSVPLINLRDQGFELVSIPEAKVVNQTYLARAMLEAEVVVNLPKLKTHSLTVFTGAIKNMYGCLPEGLRVRYHRTFQGELFHSLLVDLYSAIRPHLNIMDAIVAMEGNGPANGYPRSLGLVLASADGVALDRIAIETVGLDPESVLHLKQAGQRGLGVCNLSDIQIGGEKIEQVAVSDFRSNSVSVTAIKKWLPAFIFRAACHQLELRPRLILKCCTGCGSCARTCPTGAVEIHNKVARINPDLCIACMCCNEACRFGAILTKRRIIGHLLRISLSCLRRRKP